MRKKLIIPTIAAIVLLTGCSVSNTSTENSAVSSVTTSTETKGVYGLGEQIVVEGVTYTVTVGERKQQLSGDSRIEANEGYEFATYNVHIHNTSNDDYRYSQSSFSIVTSTGEIISNLLIFDLNNELDELGSGDLATNGQRSGWIAFEIPQGDVPLEIRFETKSFSKSDSASFKIQLR
ncbi:MAG: DUF4352 domain-containing protein [Candidatus Cohnella colombiensis]|uniref:DUF4352 domain-containing protein n=1 Tax=Candidatus Cohnella colombiensis TaxID=3121368 RepID=A0AA95F3L9_9BACL|nr:MAG: DUF4352 domain-containing protein [Cohnella sp.]